MPHPLFQTYDLNLEAITALTEPEAESKPSTPSPEDLAKLRIALQSPRVIENFIRDLIQKGYTASVPSDAHYFNKLPLSITVRGSSAHPDPSEDFKELSQSLGLPYLLRLNGSGPLDHDIGQQVLNSTITLAPRRPIDEE